MVSQSNGRQTNRQPRRTDWTKNRAFVLSLYLQTEPPPFALPLVRCCWHCTALSIPPPQPLARSYNHRTRPTLPSWSSFIGTQLQSRSSLRPPETDKYLPVFPPFFLLLTTLSSTSNRKQRLFNLRCTLLFACCYYLPLRCPSFLALPHSIPTSSSLSPSLSPLSLSLSHSLHSHVK